MANAKNTSPTRKTYCVWADLVQRVYQHVEAKSPKEAHETAKKQPDRWEQCDWHDNNGYRLSNEVQDLATDEFTDIGSATKTKETSFEHALGPWYYRFEDDAEYASTATIVDDGDMPIATVQHQHLDPHEMLPANASLIAAAPDLLSACDQAIEFIADYAADYPDYEKSKTLVETLRRAIDKATTDSQELDP